MTKQQAIDTATAWWTQQMRGGNWDNGDAATEATHSFMSSLSKQPTREEWVTIEEAIRAAVIDCTDQVMERSQYCTGSLYSDYGCWQVDAEIQKRGLPATFKTSWLGPQKAGTNIKYVDGDWTVEAKGGYGADWIELAEGEVRR